MTRTKEDAENGRTRRGAALPWRRGPLLNPGQIGAVWIGWGGREAGDAHSGERPVFDVVRPAFDLRVAVSEGKGSAAALIIVGLTAQTCGRIRAFKESMIHHNVVQSTLKKQPL